MKYDILLSGVGGQGLMLLSAVIGEACVSRDINVVTEEQHGLAQRSGSVSAHVRIGNVHSPLILYGSADMLIALEAMEALRFIEFLKPNGFIVMDTRIQHPVMETNFLVANRNESPNYVKLDSIIEQLRKVTNNIIQMDASTIATEAGNARTANIVLLGAASTTIDFPLEEAWIKDAISQVVPERTIDVNLRAFDLGVKQTTTR